MTGHSIIIRPFIQKSNRPFQKLFDLAIKLPPARHPAPHYLPRFQKTLLNFVSLSKSGRMYSITIRLYVWPDTIFISYGLIINKTLIFSLIKHLSVFLQCPCRVDNVDSVKILATWACISACARQTFGHKCACAHVRARFALQNRAQATWSQGQMWATYISLCKAYRDNCKVHNVHAHVFLCRIWIGWIQLTWFEQKLLCRTN